MDVAFLCYIEDTVAHPGLSTLKIFPSSLLKGSLDLSCKSCVIDVSAGDGHPTVTSLHFDKLRLSVLDISIWIHKNIFYVSTPLPQNS